MTDKEIPHEYDGWWRIIETSQWDDGYIDLIGTALISLTRLVGKLSDSLDKYLENKWHYIISKYTPCFHVIYDRSSGVRY